MQSGGDIARHIAENWTKNAGLADANSCILKEFRLKWSFGEKPQGETGLLPKNRVG